jgi:hypothetical protein
MRSLISKLIEEFGLKKYTQMEGNENHVAKDCFQLQVMTFMGFLFVVRLE